MPKKLYQKLHEAYFFEVDVLPFYYLRGVEEYSFVKFSNLVLSQEKLKDRIVVVDENLGSNPPDFVHQKKLRLPTYCGRV